MKSYFNIILFFGLIVLYSTGCSKDDPSDGFGNCGDGTSWIELVSEESNNLSVAGTAYGNDPTTANCNNYKEAYRNYINALKGISSCVPGVSNAAYQQAIKEAELEVDQLCQ